MRPLNYHSAMLRKLQEIANAMYQQTNQGFNSVSELEGRIPAVKEILTKVKNLSLELNQKSLNSWKQRSKYEYSKMYLNR